MLIWPAVDIRSGKCVRHAQGDYGKETVYGHDPADMAMRWQYDGAQGIRIVDLDGARPGPEDNFESVCKILAQTNLPIILGGGIRDEDSIRKFLDIGVDRVVIGTRALKDPDWAIRMCETYPDQILLGLDARNGLLASDGWLETSDISALEFAIKMSAYSIAGIVFTDISKDGMLAGPNFEAQKQLRDAVSVPLIASGGASSLQDINRLAQLGIEGCVIGKALYEGRLTLSECISAGALEAESTQP